MFKKLIPLLVLKNLVVSGLLLLGSMSANAVIIDGKDWRQLTETSGFSYDEIEDNNVCNTSSGICTGTWDSVDFNGYTWASMADIASLFEILAPLNNVDFANSEVYLDGADSTWADSAIDYDGSGVDAGYFDATYTYVGVLGVATGGLVAGIVRTHHALNPGRTFAGAGMINDRAVGANPNCDCDTLSTANVIMMRNAGDVTRGLWMYTSPVPEPSIMALFTLGLFGIGFARRRQQS
jgi:hypothetical protein